MPNTDKAQKLVVGVLGLAVDRTGKKFLLTQRHQPKDSEVHLKWQLPGGGMEFGETPEQTLEREMMEELGITVKKLFPHPITKTSIWNFSEIDMHVLLLIYLVTIGDQTPRIGDEETADWKWLSLAEIQKLPLLQHTIEIIEDANTLMRGTCNGSIVQTLRDLRRLWYDKDSS